VLSVSSESRGRTSRCAEADLFRRWQAGHDVRARDDLVERYLPLARRLARRYARHSEPMEDLTQVASLGLLKAIDRFDPTRGNGFVAYATPTILGELRRHFRDTTWAVHVPRSVQECSLSVGKARAQLATRLGRSPTVAELAQFLEVDCELILEAIQATRAAFPVSLDRPRTDRDEDCEPLVNTIGAEDERFELIEKDASIAVALRELSIRDRRILYLRFVGELTQQEIARDAGLSQMQISRILRALLARIHDQVG
jgi:RNA polymerase sigma-B factor